MSDNFKQSELKKDIDSVTSDNPFGTKDERLLHIYKNCKDALSDRKNIFWEDAVNYVATRIINENKSFKEFYKKHKYNDGKDIDKMTALNIFCAIDKEDRDHGCKTTSKNTSK